MNACGHSSGMHLPPPKKLLIICIAGYQIGRYVKIYILLDNLTNLEQVLHMKIFIKSAVLPTPEQIFTQNMHTFKTPHKQRNMLYKELTFSTQSANITDYLANVCPYVMPNS